MWSELQSQVPLQTQQVWLFPVAGPSPSLPPYADPSSVKVPDPEAFVPKAGASLLPTERMKMAHTFCDLGKLHKVFTF